MEHLLLLHGALGAKQQLEPLKTALQDRFVVHTLNFEGHGGRPASQPYSIGLFVQNVLDYLSENGISNCVVFGYSMGGYVALKLASLFPGKIRAIVTLGTKFAWSPEIALKETAMLNPQKIEEKVPKFAAALEQLHTPLDWKKVMNDTAEMMRGLGDDPALTPEDFEKVRIPVTLLLGSEDTMVTPEETLDAQARLDNALFMRVDGWQHPIDRVDTAHLADLIGKRFA
jgi:pimeloyl-ACP methyl ester carboxylesterase